MCGIVGYVGYRNAASLIMAGLERLEYRGYDSAGVAVQQSGAIAVRRGVGKLSNLRAKLDCDPLPGHIGIGHTRWATHGAPVERNAHPHLSMNGDFVLVHNGIVENYVELRETLMAEGVRFASDTDTEVIVQLIARFAGDGARGNLAEATRMAVGLLRGAHAIVVMSRHEPDRLVAVRVGNAGGVSIGLGEGENFIASDMPAFLEQTRRVVFLEHGQMAIITQNDYCLQSIDGKAVCPKIHKIDWDPVSAARGEYTHFMQKEIFEQARSLTDTLRGRVDFEQAAIVLPELNLQPERARTLTRLVTVACGTSYYSALVGKFYFEQLARLCVEVDYSSEYRYRDPIADANTAVLAITQSGETVDTLAAMEEARRKGVTLWSIVNAIGSQAMRMAEGTIAMNAGPEIAVASTKAFTASIVDQLLLALYLGQIRGTLSDAEIRRCIREIARLPGLVSRVLDQHTAVEQLAKEVCGGSHFFFLGRGIHYPVALEGALKLKEISYIHAEGFAAGEMKHGPIALVDNEMLVLAIAPRDGLYEKMVSQIEQAKARGATVIAVATEGDPLLTTKADKLIYIPEASPLLSPILAAIPLQLLAYYIAVLRGKDVDQPRNLAKSVTVE
jgi:glucosamine--fructose-6-phosphate aminotransferase (isomerizing)